MVATTHPSGASSFAPVLAAHRCQYLLRKPRTHVNQEAGWPRSQQCTRTTHPQAFASLQPPPFFFSLLSDRGGKAKVADTIVLWFRVHRVLFQQLSGVLDASASCANRVTTTWTSKTTMEGPRSTRCVSCAWQTSQVQRVAAVASTGTALVPSASPAWYLPCTGGLLV